jgi:hypothetical protein
MPNPRPHSIVKLIDPNSTQAVNFQLSADDRFIYIGEIAQEPNRCIVEGLYCKKKLIWLSPSDFEEVDVSDI